MTSISQWIDSKNSVEWWIYAKRLSANETGLTRAHQAGIYLPREAGGVVLPSISIRTSRNPERPLKARITSHAFPEQDLRAIYYNNRFFGGSRNEYRLTQWNTGVKDSPIQDPENTGALVFFAFYVPNIDMDAEFLDVWICKGLEEEEFVESQIGEVIPGSGILDRGDKLFAGFAHTPDAVPSRVMIPQGWVDVFPGGEEIIAYLPEVFRFVKTTPDELIIERRKKEYKLFRQIEELHILNRVRGGFDSVDEFMQVANSVSNRRKSRSGKSLEIHLDHLFRQFGLETFSTQCRTEGNKRPDFIFPSCSAYHDQGFPEENLRMLAVKTTCKDRWRQILNEANRVENIHLFTLQEGVSPHQFAEMTAENVTLVVPKPLHDKYPPEVSDKLLSLNEFIEATKGLGRNG